MTIFPLLPSPHGNCKRESHPMPQPLYLYSSGSIFLVSFAASNKQLPSVKPIFNSFDHVYYSHEMYKLTTFL